MVQLGRQFGPLEPVAVGQPPAPAFGGHHRQRRIRYPGIGASGQPREQAGRADLIGRQGRQQIDQQILPGTRDQFAHQIEIAQQPAADQAVEHWRSVFDPLDRSGIRAGQMRDGSPAEIVFDHGDHRRQRRRERRPRPLVEP